MIEYLSTEVDVSIQDVEGNTPLHITVKGGDSDILVQMLLHSPHATMEAANTQNGLGRTPLQEAVLLRKANLVQAIGQIADVNICDCDGRTALHYALTGKATTCLELLLMHNANVSV